MSVHVDDMLLMTAAGPSDPLKADLKVAFEWGGWAVDDVKYCGRWFVRDPVNSTITVSQTDFIAGVGCLPPSPARARQLNEPLTASERTEFRPNIGSLQWLAGNSRPDLSAATSLLQDGNPQVRNLVDAQKLL